MAGVGIFLIMVVLIAGMVSWDGAEPNIDIDQDHLDFACSVGGSTPNMAATLNQLDFECAAATLSSYETSPISDKIEMMLIDSPPTPPVNVSRTTVNTDHLSASAFILSDVPTSEWTDGCTATSAGMLFGYYDRTGYPNMYTGPTNGGVCPLTDLGQGDPTNPRYPIPGSCYIIATENGLDGISSNAHADDYWISYGSAGPDPWEGNWPEHTWGLCTADFLGTNQWKWDYSSFPGTDGVIDTNTDGSTTYWTTGDGSKLYDFYPGPAYGTPTTSCCHGMRLFAESRGYSVEANYNQLTDNQNPNGFTFAEFQSEINAGRPVLIHVTGHTMVGIGYDTTPNSIYIHDTWDNDVHSMNWGGSYADRDLRAVTIIHLAPPTEYSLTISSTSGGSVTTPGEGIFTYTYGTPVQLTATADPGWTFSAWSGDLTGSTNPDTVTMDSDKTVTATFTQDQYTLTVNTVGSGSVSKNPDQATYTYGTPVQLTATADPGWTFSAWSGDLTGSTNPDTVTMNGDRTVTATFTQAPPTITSVSPSSGIQGQTLSVTINGTYFTGTTSVGFGSGITVNSFTVDSSTQITASVSISGSATTGARDVSVITPGGTATKTGSFTVNQAPPTVNTVSPDSGIQGQTLSSVTITGTYLTGATSVSFDSGIMVNSFTVDSSTQITADISISSGATPGARDVSVTTPGGTATKTGGFTVNQAPPTISTVSPNSGVQGETLSSVTITGTYFTGATSVSFGSEITVNNFTVNSATQIMANIFISSGATPGARDVSVTTPGGTATKTSGFTVTQPTPQLMEGDVTLDKFVKASDAMFILQYLVGTRTLSEDQLKCADTTDDGEVSAVDAMHILQWLVDSDGSLGVLYKPLWESPEDDDLLEPDPG